MMNQIEKTQLNNEFRVEIIDSILNAGFNASVVVDKETFEILYQNKKALELFGDKVDFLCYEVFKTMEVPCADCPINNASSETESHIIYNDVLQKAVNWQFSKIKWFDGKDAVLVTMIDSVELQTPVGRNGVYGKANDVEMQELDSLTYIPNYNKFYINAEKTIRENPDKTYAIVVFDIDKFKTINDLYGMPKGDDALKHIGRSLKDLFGYEDNYARMHSDMFAFYISYANKGEIIREIELIRKKIASNDLEFNINTSYGIYLVEDMTVPINLMCDRAMIASRTAKGNVMKFCAFYDEQYRADMLKANEIERDMNSALENEEFKMYLQPKYRLDDGQLCGAEVLCRWIHPKKGLIPPMDFIPLFEKNGFILKLDEYMWEQACKTIKGWMDEGRNPVPISVNISRYHIHNNDLESVLTSLINKYDIPTHLLTLEITESLFLDKPEELNRELVKLQKLGFKLEVDDFGSGFSSLNLIRNITVDTIKIDKDFLDSEISSDKGKIVINHTIDMAKDLHLQVIAEGVETQQHVDFLKSSHCDIAQGYYFAKPMPLEEFNKFSF